MNTPKLRLKINHRLAIPKYFDFWNNFTLVLKYDAVGSVFSFDFLFDPSNQEHAELFAVSHFHEAIVEYNGETLVTGFILSQSFKSSRVKHLAKIGGYSKTGVLEDCEIPPSIYPLQTDGLTFAQIAKRICDKFKLEIEIDPAVASKMNKVIKTITVEETDNIKTVLTKIALQRKIIVTHNAKGNLFFTEAKTNSQPLFRVSDGMIGTEIELIFDGQKLHSDITVMKEVDSEGGNAGQETIENPFVPVAYTYRPKVVKQSSGDDSTLREFGMQVLKAELKEAIVLKITTDRWEILNKMIKPDNTITVYSPENYIYKDTSFFIEEITFKGDQKSTTATLRCVLPTCYDSSEPVNVFIEPHENFPRFNFSKNASNKSVFKS
jgi:prophage tail gpP-like protein